MSRIGRLPIPIPGGVEVNVRRGAARRPQVTVTGPMGVLERTFGERVEVAVRDGQCQVSRVDDEAPSRAHHGLTRALLNNMIIGVSRGYSKTLKIVGVGYRAAAKGDGLDIQVGFSHNVDVAGVAGVEFEVPDPVTIIVKGIDKELVGQVAADIRKIRPPEPYKGKGIRYENEYVRRKGGKTGVTS